MLLAQRRPSLSRTLRRSAGPEPQPLDIVEFIDPPDDEPIPESAASEPTTSVVQRMFEALLDPRAIHWMLTIGGGLCILGLIIWLISKGVFDDPRYVAVALGAASLGVMGGGWWVTLKTRYRVAGQALTFLGCVVAPLNLWFYHSQGLITIDQHLWIGGLLCVALYGTTVRVLRDPLFMYAVEAGVTLTTLLLMADLGLITDAGHLAMFLAILGGISIHVERAFPVEGEFNRKRFGLPAFWCGHAQLGSGLLFLLGSQSFGWQSELLKFDWPGNLVTENSLLATGIWLAGLYLYLYSDLVVRHIRVYTYLGAVCLMLAEVTLAIEYLEHEALIAMLAASALALQVVRTKLTAENEGAGRHLAAIGAVLAAVSVLMGVFLHLRATSDILEAIGLTYETSQWFVGAMVVVALCHRASAYLCRHDLPCALRDVLLLQCGQCAGCGGRAAACDWLAAVVSSGSGSDADPDCLHLRFEGMAWPFSGTAARQSGPCVDGGDYRRDVLRLDGESLPGVLQANRRQTGKLVSRADICRSGTVLQSGWLVPSPKLERILCDSRSVRCPGAVPGILRSGRNVLSVDLFCPGARWVGARQELGNQAGRPVQCHRRTSAGGSWKGARAVPVRKRSHHGRSVCCLLAGTGATGRDIFSGSTWESCWRPWRPDLWPSCWSRPGTGGNGTPQATMALGAVGLLATQPADRPVRRGRSWRSSVCCSASLCWWSAIFEVLGMERSN